MEAMRFKLPFFIRKFTVVSVCTLLTMMGCSYSFSSEQEVAESTYAVLGAINVKGHAVIPIEFSGQTYWYASSEAEGLWLLDKTGHKAVHQKGHYEALSIQPLSPFTDLVAALNKESGLLEILTFDRANKQFQLIDRIENPLAKYESQCFHQSPEGYISLLTIDVRGMVDEWAVYDQINKAYLKQKMRTFAAAPNTVACASDGERIYLAEEHIGVWSIPAHLETDPVRIPVFIKSNKGILKENVSGLSLLDDKTLVVSSEDANAIYLVNTHMVSMPVKTVQFAGDIKPRTAHGLITENSLLLSIYDDDRDRYINYRTPYHRKVVAQRRQPLIKRVEASFETDPVRKYGDAADDPAIWINAGQLSLSRILGTDKRSGLSVYDLRGKELEHLHVGRLNNVDLRTRLQFGDNVLSIAAASNRTKNSISLFELNEESAQVKYLSDVSTSLDEVYGLCMAHRNNRPYVIVNDIDGRYQVFELIHNGRFLTANKVREFALPSQPEGCVVDDETGYLYMGEEGEGIWRTSIDLSNSKVEKIVSVGQHLTADIEGLAIYSAGENEKYLVVSSQGDNSYALYRIDHEMTLTTRFRVGVNLKRSIDGTSETDGLAVTSQALPGFPKGLLVVQDGRNRLPTAPQNFKIIDWENIEKLLTPQE